MKFKHEETITIPIPEQFQKDWGHIVHDWLQKNHENYPNSVIESIDPNITNPRSQGCPRFQSGEELANSVGKINAC